MSRASEMITKLREASTLSKEGDIKNKKVVVIDTPKNTLLGNKARFRNKEFKKYGAILKLIEPGESVIVGVYEITAGPNPREVFAGYGEVSKIQRGEIVFPCTPRTLRPKTFYGL